MSIPPLVCSTPPPPDQCEDDKDPEDFDLAYNLSQDEDDEDNVYFGGFSSYSNFQSPHNRPHDINDQNSLKNMENVAKETDFEDNEEIKHKSSKLCSADDTSENKHKCEEDINIEDLNLELSEEITNVESDSEEIKGDENKDDSLKDLQVPSVTTISQDNDNTDSLSFDENTVDPTDYLKGSSFDLDTVITSETKSISEVKVDTENVLSLQKAEIECTVKSFTAIEDNVGHPDIQTNTDTFSRTVDGPTTRINMSPDESMLDDDFGDFDDFQFVSPETKVINIVNDCDNPWESSDANNSEFNNFTANFDQVQFPDENVTSHNLSNDDAKENQSTDMNINLEDDDFGDFDDFKSSTGNTDGTSQSLDHSTPCQDVHVLNLHSTQNEQQVMESISKILTSIFLEEITEPEHGFEGKLESLLSETWGHLMETDERQPYIVNWNNSLGQKTLLKALCIDSRNILFGPKWNSHMPKYAANLSAAPLQPQKPLTPSSAALSDTNMDKSSSKPSTWSDPFISDGQEFTYAEALLLDLEHLMATLDQMAHNHTHSTIKISELLSHACNPDNETPPITTGPTDLDVFEAAMSTKHEKMYSSTLSVQPLRQINLPDTHIFTPTDSETPRSKTIHYDCTPAALLPQSASDTMNHQNMGEPRNNFEDDSEYCEFQDFKSSNLQVLTNIPYNEKEKSLEPAKFDKSLPPTSIPFQTQPLQPIKVETTTSKLNWPEPGEVKDVFDDFSDFISISSQNTTEQQNIGAPNRMEITEEISDKSENQSDLNENVRKVSHEVISASSDNFDDFDTFQSALPTKPAINSFNINHLSNSTNQTSNQVPDFSYVFPKTINFKSDTISFPSITKMNEALTQHIGLSSNTAELTNKGVTSGAQLHGTLLQPTPATSGSAPTQSQQKTGQILQPLSLESYSQINWPSPGIDLQDLSRFNPVETLQSLKTELSVGGHSKGSSPVHIQKNHNSNQAADDDVWGEFVSSKPKPQPSAPKKPPVFVDDDEWTEFISSPSVKPQNGLNTISLNVHTNSNIQKNVMQNKFTMKTNQMPVDIPTLNYITPKTSNPKSYNDRHFQNL